MGASATQGRRALVDKVGECIAANNNLAGKLEEVGTANNKLAKQTGEDVASLKGRCDSLNAWCKRTEMHANLTRAAHEQQAFEMRWFLHDLTVWQRLLWVLTGAVPALPVPRVTSDTVKADDLERAYRGHKAVLASDAQKALPNVNGPSVMPHTSMGPRSLP